MANQKEILLHAFDQGITNFDLANNYGGGSAKRNFGLIFNEHLHSYRDELIISTKAGYRMWDGPYGDGGSRKYLIASCDSSLKRLGIDYVDIFYHHRFDCTVPLEETAYALNTLVENGKALYVGVSNYSVTETRQISQLFDELKTPFIVNQIPYNMFQRTFEDGVKDAALETGIGTVSYSPLAQGQLSARYLKGFRKTLGLLEKES
ncbi:MULTISPECIES: aldo/keto reductase [Listeria]|uniref:aldo/keto reductase n=1 Tax=Listeria TaxID=1637 RepID=UPI000EED8836|nr:L-glyceraldehyde 3-phosphate reductase [Listeria monocytogenes]